MEFFPPFVNQPNSCFEYHILWYLIIGGNYQDHNDNNIFLLRWNRHYLFLKHCLSYVLMKTIVNFMFNGIVDEALVDDGIKFICFSTTSFVTRFISYTSTSLGQNSIHYYLLFVLKFVIWAMMQSCEPKALNHEPWTYFLFYFFIHMLHIDFSSKWISFLCFILIAFPLWLHSHFQSLYPYFI